MRKLTSMVMVHNNEGTIRKCIGSFKDISDEIIIIDDFSTDSTIEIVKKMCPDVKIFRRKLDHDFASQRNFALSKVSNDWVLFIDSDEYLTQSLKNEIINELRNPGFKAYISRRDNQVMDMWFPNNSGRPILLKKNLRFKNRLHEQVYGVKFGYMKKPLMHISWKDCKAWVEDLNDYSSMTAEKWIKENRNFSRFQIFLIGAIYPFVNFIKIYLIGGRWRGGMPALIYCMGCSAEWCYNALKYYEMKYVIPKKKNH